MTTDDAETVAEVLEETIHSHGHTAMYRLLKGRMDASELSYEQWVNPMKLTGGRVCLRCDWEGNVWFHARCMAGMLVTVDRGADPEDTDVSSPAQVQNHLNGADVSVTPVLREDTPFGED